MTKPSIMSTNKPLPFGELSPLEFERLCLWLIEREGYLRPQHLGEAGGEQGRDIVAYKPTDGGGELWYFQCKRYKRIGATTLKKDVDKYNRLAESDPALQPAGIVFVTNAVLSARVRDDVASYCRKHGYAYDFWARTELDMRIKKHHDVVQEFFNAGSEVLQQVASDLRQLLAHAGLAEPKQATQTIVASLQTERPLLFEKDGMCSGHPIKPSPEEYFVAHEFSEAKIADLRRALAEGLRDLNPNLKPYTADQDTGSGHILCKIAAKIHTTLFSIFDLPRSQNRNVYLELGVAIGLGRPFILIKEQVAGLPSLVEGLDYFGFASYTKGGHESRFSAGQKSVSWSAQSVVDEVHP